MPPASRAPIRRRFALFVAALAVLGVTGACGSGGSNASSATVAPVATAGAAAAAAPGSSVRGTVTVFAAASLSSAFDDVRSAFTEANPRAKVAFSFDASSALAQQIAQGAPADVFASADEANMDKLTRAGLERDAPRVFATNVLTIIVPKGNPKGLTGVADLAKPNLKVVLCAEPVPCGTYAKQILGSAKVTVTPVSLEQNVKGVVTKVTAGEADAGIVYATDVAAAGAAAEALAIPGEVNVVARYPIATVKGSRNLAAAEAFVGFLLGPEAQAILARYGFGRP